MRAQIILISALKATLCRLIYTPKIDHKEPSKHWCCFFALAGLFWQVEVLVPPFASQRQRHALISIVVPQDGREWNYNFSAFAFFIHFHKFRRLGILSWEIIQALLVTHFKLQVNRLTGTGWGILCSLFP